MHLYSHLKYLVFCVLYFACNIVYGQVSFTASANPATVGVNEQFELTFSLNASGNNFQPPAFRDFLVIAGPNQSTSMQFINGSMSQSLAFSYILQPKSTGTFKIGKASIESGGKSYQSEPVTITVNSSGGNSGNKNAGDGEASIAAQIEKNVFIRAVVSKTSVVRGEPIKVVYKLFSKVDLVDLNVTKVPTLNGFWSHEDAPIRRIEPKREMVDGQEYITAELKRAVLFPQREGQLIIDPLEAETVVRIRTKRKSRNYDPFEDFFNDPFFGGNVQDFKHVAKSAPVKIQVNALPGNAPADFTGAVGSFSMESFIDKPQTKSNEPVTLKIKISGEGNINLIDPVKLSLPPDIESYDPKISQSAKTSDEGVSGQKSFEYLLIPRHPGEFKIKPFQFSYYSLAKKKYITLESPEFNLKVVKGNDEPVTTLPSGAKNDVQFIGKDIRYIKTEAELQKKSGYFFGSKAYYLLLASPVALLLLTVFFKRRQEEQEADEGFKSKKATKVAKSRLTLAKAFIDQGNHDKAYEEILRSVWGYLSDKFKIPLSDLSRNTIEQILLSRKKDPAIIQELLQLIDQCEMARYAPSLARQEIQKTYQSAVTVIEKLEDQ